MQTGWEREVYFLGGKGYTRTKNSMGPIFLFHRLLTQRVGETNRLVDWSGKLIKSSEIFVTCSAAKPSIITTFHHFSSKILKISNNQQVVLDPKPSFESIGKEWLSFHQTFVQTAFYTRNSTAEFAKCQQCIHVCIFILKHDSRRAKWRHTVIWVLISLVA